jgi:hypothetical protein
MPINTVVPVRVKATVPVVAGTATLIQAATPTAVTLRITNTTPKTTAYVSQNANITVASAGNCVLHPFDCMAVEGVFAQAAWYGITDVANNAACFAVDIRA